MIRKTFTLAAVVAFAVTACGQDSDSADQRDLTLLPTDSVAMLDDAPRPDSMAGSEAPTPEQQAPAQPVRRPPPSPPSLMAGTAATLFATDTLTSRHNKVGDTVTAFVDQPVLNDRGVEIIPAGALFFGTISDVAPAESPGGEGRMALTFTDVEIEGYLYPVSARVDSIATHMKGRGVTVGDAAKVGAGTAVGAVAGRILGGNKTGTLVGAAVGTAAGVGIAAATRDIDILLDAGAPMWLVFTAPFERP